MMKTQAATDSPALEQVASAPASVLLVDDDPDYLGLVEREIGRDERLEILTACSAPDTLDRIADVDCVVSALEMEPRTGLELLETIRDREPTLPFVLHTNASIDAVSEGLFAHERTDYLQKGGPESIELLRRRIRRLVERHQSTALLQRTLVGLDAARDGIAIVDPDGTVQYANRQYAARFDTDAGAVIGTDWRERYPDAEVVRLESEAIPTAEDGWRWTGTCVGLRADGETFSAQMALVGVGDAGLVFVVDAPLERSA